MRGFFLGLSLAVAFIVGCVAGASGLVVPPASAQQQAMRLPRWEYFCAEISLEPGDVTSQANKLGAQHWELVANGRTTGYADLWCFKRQLP